MQPGDPRPAQDEETAEQYERHEEDVENNGGVSKKFVDHRPPRAP